MRVIIIHRLRVWALIGWCLCIMTGCVHQLQAIPAPESLKGSVVFGQIHVWQAEPSGRIFLPELASFEFIRQEGGARYRVEVEADTSWFAIPLEPGEYQVTRLIMREGEFRASAEVPLRFESPTQGLAYIGKWSIQVEAPNFRRELVFKVETAPTEALVELRLRYPRINLKQVVTRLTEPTIVRARLYEMTPYPRFRWFNRHNPT